MQVSAVDVTGRPTKHVQGAVDDGHGLQVTEKKQLGRKETWQQRLKKNFHPPEVRCCLQSSALCIPSDEFEGKRRKYTKYSMVSVASWSQNEYLKGTGRKNSQGEKDAEARGESWGTRQGRKHKSLNSVRKILVSVSSGRAVSWQH